MCFFVWLSAFCQNYGSHMRAAGGRGGGGVYGGCCACVCVVGGGGVVFICVFVCAGIVCVCLCLYRLGEKGAGGVGNQTPVCSGGL